MGELSHTAKHTAIGIPTPSPLVVIEPESALHIPNLNFMSTTRLNPESTFDEHKINLIGLHKVTS